MLLLFFCWALNFSFELNFVFGILFRIRFRNQTNDKNSVKPTADAFSWYCFWITSKQHLSVHAREQELMLLTRVHPPNKFTTANRTPLFVLWLFVKIIFCTVWRHPANWLGWCGIHDKHSPKYEQQAISTNDHSYPCWYCFTIYVEIGAGFLSTKYFVFTLSAFSVVTDVKCWKV